MLFYAQALRKITGVSFHRHRAAVENASVVGHRDTVENFSHHFRGYILDLFARVLTVKEGLSMLFLLFVCFLLLS